MRLTFTLSVAVALLGTVVFASPRPASPSPSLSSPSADSLAFESISGKSTSSGNTGSETRQIANLAQRFDGSAKFATPVVDAVTARGLTPTPTPTTSYECIELDFGCHPSCRALDHGSQAQTLCYTKCHCSACRFQYCKDNSGYGDCDWNQIPPVLAEMSGADLVSEVPDGRTFHCRREWFPGY